MRLTKHTVVVPITPGTDSTEADLREVELLGLEMPAAWTAATISFLSLVDNDDTPATAQTFLPVVDGAGASIVLTVAASQYVVLTEAQRMALAGLGRTKLRVSIAQAAARTVKLLVRPRS